MDNNRELMEEDTIDLLELAKVLPAEIANIISGSSAMIVDSALSAERLLRGDY